MHVQDLAALEGFKTEHCELENLEITDAYCGDLLSDVMGNAPSGSVLVTIQAHKNTVAVASLAGIRALVICNNRSVPPDMLEAAKEEGISIFTTKDTQFGASCKIAKALGRLDAGTP
ncbi:MAG: iron-sulfur binding hydrogenase [Sphaerochaeta sp.]|uniref:iron-sulfur binding hydrogenase n=1 Tax=Sphaerochaeta sp. TaxID=1972642 RepID=UPI003D0DFF8F